MRFNVLAVCSEILYFARMFGDMCVVCIPRAFLAKKVIVVAKTIAVGGFGG